MEEVTKKFTLTIPDSDGYRDLSVELEVWASLEDGEWFLELTPAYGEVTEEDD
jgi:hypothetical protein